ncbi:hypothetical protein EMIHUDRAFT_224951 [Emiliania huxleyi CCMP1516]|uniref:K Homology domain-containing protein n=2 Tax=Emiliania huxleyi TaxID=2903 RepID=A0A0D3KQB4_EMIH1|nr:hypothetical protein EMIHUDRAFT_224951 [Emiliania huxleyi CCMP1516]EOD37949.1 hypothetical protein EMIHUDRAFT_224951 [Emiliania huxleyi CCMP1516]|eukprot:XP_005790378.1 hypothetical protein EMIHUDRAFT_224951 [Emiliania huxleyi CCMP1516]
MPAKSQRAPVVEVVDDKALSYTPGTLKDIRQSKYLIDLGGGDQWVDWQRVREAAPPCTEFIPQPDSIIEVRKAGAEEVWFEAKVKSVKGGYTVAVFLGSGGGEEIVEWPHFRPAYSRVAPARSRPPFVKQANEQRVVSDVVSKSKVLAFEVDRDVHQIKLLGAEKACATAKMLIELHGKHVGDMARVHSEREQLSAKLQHERERLISSFRLEFPVDKELIGLVVGKGGATAAGVDKVEVDPDGPRVVIVGPSQESIEAARELLEFVSRREQIGWLIGKGGRTFKELQEKTQAPHRPSLERQGCAVTRLSIDKAAGQVVLVGTRTAVDSALAYMDTHLQYLSEFEHEARESERLRRELRGITLQEEDEMLPDRSRSLQITREDLESAEEGGRGGASPAAEDQGQGRSSA